MIYIIPQKAKKRYDYNTFATKRENTNLKHTTMVHHLTTQEFKDKVFNYDKHQEWKFEGTRPALIDFYADWCGPCKMVAPILEDLAKEYEGKIDIYKINTEQEVELSQAFGIRSIPSLLFVPMEGLPQMAQGAMQKDGFKVAFKDVLNVQ